MKNFYLIANENRDRGMEFSKKLVAYINEQGGTAEASFYEDIKPENISKSVECLIVLGGDGTFIRVATKMEALKLPVIGVNLGTLGYLCELDEESVFPAIGRMMDNDCYVEERMMLTGTDGKINHLALNDVVVHAGEQNFLTLRVMVDKAMLATYHADGIILSTPTGSTGYNLSAGGPIVDPKSHMILLTPISDHNITSKSIVLDSDSEIEIVLDKRRPELDEKAYVSFDGDRAIHMSVGDKITVRKASTVIRVLRLDKKSFLEILRKKMEGYIR